MASPPNPRPLPKVSCLCGADVRVDVMSSNRKVTCGACSSTFDYVVTMDAAKRNSRISLILPRSALGLPSMAPSKMPTPPPAGPKTVTPKAVTRVPRKVTGKTTSAILATCECGELFPLTDDGELASIQSCPHCKRSYHVAFRIDAATRTKTPMLAPQDPRARRPPPGPTTKKPRGTTQ